MRTYTWDEYYEKFHDWAESTQVRNLSALTSLGTADVTVIVPIVHLTMDIVTTVGITVKTMFMVVSLVVIKVAVAWIK